MQTNLVTVQGWCCRARRHFLKSMLLFCIHAFPRVSWLLLETCFLIIIITKILCGNLSRSSLKPEQEHEHPRNSLGSNSRPWICYANPLSLAHPQHVCYIQYWTPFRLYREHRTAGPVRTIPVCIYRERGPLPPSTEWGPALSHLYMEGRTLWSFNIVWAGSSLGVSILSGPWSSERSSTQELTTYWGRQKL